MEMKLPKISVILPTFNRSDFLENSIKCLLAQNYNNLEFIVIDGGSTDEQTLQILNKYKDHFDYFMSEHDNGMWHALNKGILASTGEYLYLLNSDDLLYDNALNKIGGYLSLHPDIDMVYGEASRINEKDEVLGWHNARKFNKDYLIHKRNFIPTQACFFKKELIAYVGLFDTSMIWNSDWDMWKKIAKVKDVKIVFLNEKIGKWRIYRNTLSYGDGSKIYKKKYIETYRNLRTHSVKFITLAELKMIPHIIVGTLGLRKVLRNIRNKLYNK